MVEMTIAEGFGKAREAAERALQLEPDLAEGHAALGRIRIFHDWDWEGADEALRRALDLAPGDANVICNTAALAGNLGRSEEALALVRGAVALDPLSASAQRSLARLSLEAGLLEEAEAAAEKALELNPQGRLTHYWLGLVRLRQGRLDEALEAFQREGHDVFRLFGLAMAQHTGGRPAESDASLQELINSDATGSAYQIAEAYAFRGETNVAFEWLERAYEQHDPVSP